MKISDIGVMDTSFIDFTFPSSFAKETLYYPTEYGSFICNSQYRIERKSLDQFLFFYVKSGMMNVRVDGREEEAHEGSVVLMNCRQPHAYWCSDRAEFLWFHFDGCNADGYTKYLRDKYGSFVLIPEDPDRVSRNFERLFAYLQEDDVNEHLVSLQISSLFAILAGTGEGIAGNNLFAPVVQHIRAHYDEEIRLDDLMDICGLSKSYFIREFKKHIGSTPHEYLLAFRLRQAKLMLQTSDSSIEEISEKCGFNSTSHFARAFKKENQMTPTEFRNIRF